MPDDKVAIFKQTELFRELDEAIVGSLAKRAHPKRLAPNEILFLAGEPAAGMYVIASGSVRAFRTNHEGREQIIHVEQAISTIAEIAVFDGGNYPSTVAAEEDTNLYFLKKEHVLDLAVRHPQLALAAVRLLASRLRRCAELIEILALREVSQRLAKFLLVEAKLHGTRTDLGTRIVLPLTHNQLASRIGTVREVVSRALTRLHEEGLIIHEGKNILIPDLAMIAAYSEN